MVPRDRPLLSRQLSLFHQHPQEHQYQTDTVSLDRCGRSHSYYHSRYSFFPVELAKSCYDKQLAGRRVWELGMKLKMKLKLVHPFRDLNPCQSSVLANSRCRRRRHRHLGRRKSKLPIIETGLVSIGLEVLATDTNRFVNTNTATADRVPEADPPSVVDPDPIRNANSNPEPRS